MVTLYNLTAIGQQFSTRPGVSYVVGVDGTVAVDEQDVHTLIAQGFQLNAANPLNLPYLGVKSTGNVSIPNHSCIVVAFAVDPDTVNFNMPAAKDSGGCMFFFSNMGDGAATITLVPGDLIQGEAGPRNVGTHAIVYSDGGTNFYILG